MIKAYFISIDFQYDFVEIGGKNPCFGNSPQFIKNELIPWFRKKNIEIFEIVSDYRLPRGKSHNESCVPNTLGYKSLIPESIKNRDVFIKCMHNPSWSRENIGDASRIAGDVYPDPSRFSHWLRKNLPNCQIPVILFGETMECCVLNVAQELYFRGYEIYVIYEASDPMKERINYKDEIAFHSSLAMYAKVLRFNEIVEMINSNE